MSRERVAEVLASLRCSCPPRSARSVWRWVDPACPVCGPRSALTPAVEALIREALTEAAGMLMAEAEREPTGTRRLNYSTCALRVINHRDEHYPEQAS